MGRRIRPPDWSRWRGMIQRCHPQTPSSHWVNYGARGIYVCEEWLHSIEQFVVDTGPRPVPLTLDRINNDGPYAPDNVRWADVKTQNSNQRKERPPSRTFIKWLRMREKEWLVQVEAGIRFPRLNQENCPDIPPEKFGDWLEERMERLNGGAVLHS